MMISWQYQNVAYGGALDRAALPPPHQPQRALHGRHRLFAIAICAICAISAVRSGPDARAVASGDDTGARCSDDDIARGLAAVGGRGRRGCRVRRRT